MADYMIINGELYHHGVKGMKWGVRKSRGHAGPGVYYGSNKRKLAKAKADLERLDNGGHLSIGLTKKRQAMYDARDRYALEEKISKLENRERWNMQTSERVKSFAKKGAIVVGIGLAAYGGYKAHDFCNSFDYKVNGKSVSRKEFSDSVKFLVKNRS